MFKRPPTRTLVTLIRDLAQASSVVSGGAISIGNFDGVHCGHAGLLQQLRKMADRVGGPATVLTFDPHPATILRPEQAPIPLTWIERRAELLQAQGVDHVIACRPTRKLLSFSAEAFFHQIIRDSLHAQAMVEGPNFYFGKDRQGDVDRLRQLCHEAQMPLWIAPACQEGSQMVSSSWVRRLITEGEMTTANRFLTAPYRICGVVQSGAQRGRELGVPTANLAEIPVLCPGDGVYAGRAWIGNQIANRPLGGSPSGRLASPSDTAHKAAIHIGPNPTFADGRSKVEVHLIDYDGDLYGQRLQVQLDRRIRDTQTFATVERLTEQLQRDINDARRDAGNEPD